MSARRNKAKPPVEIGIGRVYVSKSGYMKRKVIDLFKLDGKPMVLWRDEFSEGACSLTRFKCWVGERILRPGNPKLSQTKNLSAYLAHTSYIGGNIGATGEQT